MKKINKYLGLFLLAWMTVAVSSCIKDNFTAETPAEKANITINIGSRASDDDNREVKDNVDIKTLRLILVQDGKIVVNSLYDYSTEQENVLNKSIYIIGLKAVPTDFYAIVNEASVARDFTETSCPIGGPFNETYFSQAQLDSMDKVETALPMAGSIQQKAINDGDNIEILVTRAVARIDLNVINNTGSALDVSKINFGKFFPSEGFLVETQGTPATSNKSFQENQTIAANDEYEFTYYLYESLQGEYKVGMDGSTHYDLAPIIDSETNKQVTSLPRNTILKVNANANPTGWELQCNVLPWEKNEVTVDFRDELSYVSEGWDENTILGMLEGNVVHVDPNKEALLTFTIQTPNTATWKAQLEGDQEAMKAFEFVDGVSSGSVHYDESGVPLPQELKIRISEDYIESQDEHQVTLKVFAEIGGKEYELDLTNTSDESQKPEEGQIVNRYTLLQKK